MPAHQSLAAERAGEQMSVSNLLMRRENRAGFEVSATLLRGNFHIVASVCLAAALLPLLYRVGLPIQFAWGIYFRTYWIGLTLQSINLCALLCVIGMPFEQILGPLCDRFRGEKLRILIIVPLVAELVLLFGIMTGVMLTVVAIVLLELVERDREGRLSLGRTFLDVMLPATYLFVGFIIVFGYNDVIAALRFNGDGDLFLNQIDLWLMRGMSISSFSHWALAHLSSRALPWTSFIYFGMFPQVGACLILLVLCDGKSRALRFVGTILTAYYISLICFFLIPATGPYFLSHSYLSHLPSNVSVYRSQQTLASLLARLPLRHGPPIIGTDYFIAFPCMHLVQPLAVLWYLRRWKRMLIALAAYDCVLIPCILLLEQHYLVDLIGAVAVTALAIALVPDTSRPVPYRSRSLSAPSGTRPAAQGAPLHTTIEAKCTGGERWADNQSDRAVTSERQKHERL